MSDFYERNIYKSLFKKKPNFYRTKNKNNKSAMHNLKKI